MDLERLEHDDGTPDPEGDLFVSQQQAKHAAAAATAAAADKGELLQPPESGVQPAA